jgi:hypothetical protein
MFTRIPREQRPLHTRERRFLLKDIGQEAALFEDYEVTFLDAHEGAKTVEEKTVYQAGCGHFVGLVGPAELISSCGQCGATLCIRCGSLRCRRCLTLLCQDCARLVDESVVYCSSCKLKVLAKRIVTKMLGGLHAFLSKDPGA